MNTTPKGKIGRLPKALREQVNRRMENGEKDTSIVVWLNGLPEVQTLLAAQFKGQPISAQNLSLWRKHGFKSWLMRREAQDMAAEIGDLPCPADLPVTDHVATWASVHYLMTVRELVENTPEQSHLKVLREFLRDVIALRRGEQSSARLKMQHDLALTLQTTGHNLSVSRCEAQRERHCLRQQVVASGKSNLQSSQHTQTVPNQRSY